MSNLKAGDLIVAYHKGFHEVTKVVRRWKNITQTGSYYQNAYCITGTYDPATCGEEINSLVYYKKKFTQEGMPAKGRVELSCDDGFCRLAKDVLGDRIKHTQEILERLKSII